MSKAGPIPALRGYRLQFLYTLFRLLNGKENETVYPELHEDYSVKEGTQITEVAQVKNYADSLQLSHLSPLKEQGFVRRSITHLQEDPEINLKLVVLGELGTELKELKDRKKSETIWRKLTTKYQFTGEEAELFIRELDIVQIDALEVRRQVEAFVAESIAGAKVNVATDMLLYWMYQLAEAQGAVSRLQLIQKLVAIGKFISERAGFLTEFGSSILPLIDDQVQIEEKERKEFQSGVAARYSHILAGLDIERPEKMVELDQAFTKAQIVILHGASGQGKSTLAYRYAYTNYSEGYAYEIPGTTGTNRVLEIAKAVKALSHPFETPFLLIIDVAPGTAHWVDLCSQLREAEHCRLLVTIREEDLNRGGAVGEYFAAQDMSLSFSKQEAAALFDEVKAKTDIPHYLNFIDAWSQFGGKGPLLEFMFLLRQGQKLKTRLANQIAKIEDRVALEGDDNERKLLQYVSVAGAYDCRLNLPQLLKAVPLRNAQRTLRFFHDEYLLREGEKGIFLEALHPVRAKIMADLLCDPVLDSMHEVILACQPLVLEEDWGNYILQYGLYFGWNENVMSATLSLQPSYWKTCKEIHRALIWCGVNAYLESNKPQLASLRQEFPLGTDFALMKLMAPNVDLSVVTKIWKPERYARFEEILADFTPIDDFYGFANDWLKSLHCPETINYKLASEISGLGYMLFWSNKNNTDKVFPDGIFKELKKLNSQDSDREATADLLLGLQHGSDEALETAEVLLPGFLREFQAFGKVVNIDDDGDQIKLHFFFDLEGESQTFGEGFNGKAMRLLRLTRKVFPFRNLYSTQGYGHKFTEIPLPYDDSVKNINADHLPWPWLTDAKQIFFNLVKFEKRHTDWSQLLNHLLDEQRSMSAGLRSISDGLDKKMKKGNLKNGFLLVPDFRPDTKFALPKPAVDPWGFYAELKEENLKSLFHGVPLLQLLDPTLHSRIKAVKEFHQSMGAFLDMAYKSLAIKEVSTGWTEEQWKEKEGQLKELGYAPSNLRLSKVNLMDAQKHFPAYSQALISLCQDHLQTQINSLADFSDRLEKMVISWTYFIDHPIQKEGNLGNSAERKAVNIINAFQRKLDVRLIKFKSSQECTDYEVFRSEKNPGDWYLLFYVDDVIQMLRCWSKARILLNESLGAAPFYKFKRIILDTHVQNVWILTVYDDFLIRRQSFKLSLYDIVDRPQEEPSVANSALVTEEAADELSLDFAADEYPEFDQAERYNELFHTIRLSLEYLEQLAELRTEEPTGKLLLDVELKKTYLKIRKYYDEFIQLHTPLMAEVRQAVESPSSYLPATDLMENVGAVVRVFQRLEDLFHPINKDPFDPSVFDLIIVIKREVDGLMETQGGVYFAWLDMLIHVKLKT